MTQFGRKKLEKKMTLFDLVPFRLSRLLALSWCGRAVVTQYFFSWLGKGYIINSPIFGLLAPRKKGTTASDVFSSTYSQRMVPYMVEGRVPLNGIGSSPSIGGGGRLCRHCIRQYAWGLVPLPAVRHDE